MSFVPQAWWSRHDVVVAAHGASVTNLIFIRENASVIELYPYHYYPIDFLF
jgi:capsular polysaccharide biosynthesis protein